jgi:hypothetical protein
MAEAGAVSLFRFSLSLQRKQKANTLHKSKGRKRIKDKKLKSAKTYESKRSKNSISSLGAEGSPTAALEAEVLEERSSSMCFLFLSRLGSSECAGGGNVVELVPSSESLASSPSWLSSASGASDTAETGST